MEKQLLGLVGVFLLAFTLFISLIVFEKPLARFTRAKEELIPSANKTLIIAWPLILPADGQAEATINVFVRNEKEAPISNKKVSLITDLGTVKEVQPISEKNGKTEFKISSQKDGVATIKAIVDNIQVSQKVSIKFSEQ